MSCRVALSAGLSLALMLANTSSAGTLSAHIAPSTVLANAGSAGALSAQVAPSSVGAEGGAAAAVAALVPNAFVLAAAPTVALSARAAPPSVGAKASTATFSALAAPPSVLAFNLPVANRLARVARFPGPAEAVEVEPLVDEVLEGAAAAALDSSLGVHFRCGYPMCGLCLNEFPRCCRGSIGP